MARGWGITNFIQGPLLESRERVKKLFSEIEPNKNRIKEMLVSYGILSRKDRMILIDISKDIADENSMSSKIYMLRILFKIQ